MQSYTTVNRSTAIREVLTASTGPVRAGDARDTVHAVADKVPWTGATSCSFRPSGAGHAREARVRIARVVICRHDPTLISTPACLIFFFIYFFFSRYHRHISFSLFFFICI